MSLIDWFEDDDFIKKLNELSMEEIVNRFKVLPYMSVEVKDNNLVCFTTGGWSDNEMILDCLSSFLCKHHNNYVGYLIGGAHYYVMDIDKKWDYISCLFVFWT